MKKPSGQQQLAIDHFIVNRNKTEAYRAGYECKNMKPKTVNRNAVRLFNLAHIAPLIVTAIEKVSEDAGIDAAWVLKRSALLTNFNINKFLVFKKGVALYDFSKATDDDWYCISEIAIDQVGVSEDGLYLVDKIKLKAVDKLKALDQVGKNVGVQAFKESIIIQGAIATTEMDDAKFMEVRAKMLAKDDC